MPATRAQVQHAEQQRQQRALFRALALGDAREAAALLARIRSPAALSLEILGLTAMHVAAAACPALLPALAAAGAPLDGALSAVPALMPPAHVLLTIFETLDALDERQRRAMAVGFTPLACAAW